MHGRTSRPGLALRAPPSQGHAGGPFEQHVMGVDEKPHRLDDLGFRNVDPVVDMVTATSGKVMLSAFDTASRAVRRACRAIRA